MGEERKKKPVNVNTRTKHATDIYSLSIEQILCQNKRKGLFGVSILVDSNTNFLHKKEKKKTEIHQDYQE